jgi:alkanesulfonate monooxygenase SsuD/methylene tetrahydromethanopterin reductase-like flavin-dependent oxidoreductase (luciferase family)
MKVNFAISAHNSADWDRVQAGQFDRPSDIWDVDIMDGVLALTDLAEPLGFDGIWAPEHFGTPYSMSPNSMQVLAWVAGRTERVSLGTMVIVLPWWNPVRLAHQIAYVDIVSKGRYNTIGLGRGVAKTEFDSLGVPRDESRIRFEECLDIIEMALTQERFSYDGQIFKIPESSIRPQPRSRDLTSRFYGASSTNTSLELMARRGLKPLFVGNKPLTEAAKDVRLVNTYRREMGLPPCQSKNILFMYCTSNAQDAKKANEFIASANKDVALHYGFGDPNSFKGVKGYEAYAAAQAAATALTTPGAEKPHVGSDTTYDQSNLLIGTPDEIIERIRVGQEACSFSEICIVPNFGTMMHGDAEKSLRLFAKEVLPVVQKMDAPLHAPALPEPELEPAAAS